jgi:hypothetical protein
MEECKRELTRMADDVMRGVGREVSQIFRDINESENNVTRWDARVASHKKIANNFHLHIFFLNTLELEIRQEYIGNFMKKKFISSSSSSL